VGLTRREMIVGTGAAFSAVVSSPYVSRASETYPARHVTIVNQFAAGSISDTTSRLIAQSLQDQLGQPFVVENKPGAGGLIAATAVARAKPDGYTLLATVSSLHSAAALYKEMPLDLMGDFTHIARLVSYPSFMTVRSTLPINTVQDLIAYAKANPAKLTYGHGNNMGQMVGEIFKRRTGVDLTRVAYRSNPAAMSDLVAGHIDVMVADIGTGWPHVESQKARPLAVFSKQRSALMPSVPTLDETVMPGFDVLPWGGLSGPAKMPSDVVGKLDAAISATFRSPETQKRFSAPGMEPYWADQRTFEIYVQDQLKNWTALIKEAGIPPQ